MGISISSGPDARAFLQKVALNKISEMAAKIPDVSQLNDPDDLAYLGSLSNMLGNGDKLDKYV